MKTSIVKRSGDILKSLAVAVLLTVILLLILTALLTFTSLKEDRIPLINTVIMILSIVIGSISLAFKVEEKGWLNGGLIGILYFLVVLLINFLFIKPFIFDIYTIGKLLICTVAGVIGGMIGVNIK
ncbi:MAG TPA: TIGR04086 family membrane protein [Tissierellia bacterium]|nr:TIGR04086 family membrane protein [Tissierellia bacterium]